MTTEPCCKGACSPPESQKAERESVISSASFLPIRTHLLAYSSHSTLSSLILARAQLARKNDAATGSFCTRLFSPISSCLYLPCLYLPCLYLSLVFISPLFLYLPCLYLPCLYIALFLYLPCFYISLVFISLPCFYLPCFYISLVFISPPNPGPLTPFILSVPIHAQQATPPHQARSFS